MCEISMSVNVRRQAGRQKATTQDGSDASQAAWGCDSSPAQQLRLWGAWSGSSRTVHRPLQHLKVTHLQSIA